MSDARDLVRESAERLFAKYCTAETMRRADGGEFPQALWRALAEAGYAGAESLFHAFETWASDSGIASVKDLAES